MYERILVPLDGSNLAEIALPYAEELAWAFDSEVFLLGVSKSAEDHTLHMYQLYMEQIAEFVKSHIEEHREEGEGGRVRVNSAIMFGEPAEGILDYSEKNDISLTVATTHACSGLKRWAMGSIANRLLRETKTPMILIRSSAPHPEAGKRGLLSKILVALDSSDAGEAVLPYVEEIATKLKAEVILLQVVASGQHVHTIGGLD